MREMDQKGIGLYLLLHYMLHYDFRESDGLWGLPAHLQGLFICLLLWNLFNIATEQRVKIYKRNACFLLSLKSILKKIKIFLFF